MTLHLQPKTLKHRFFTNYKIQINDLLPAITKDTMGQNMIETIFYMPTSVFKTMTSEPSTPYAVH
jgi:hypothetical protein